MLTKRDLKIIEFVEKLPCYGYVLRELYWPGKTSRAAYYRLAYLADYKYIKRDREGTADRYFYYSSKKKISPDQKIHLDLLAKTYLYLHKQGYGIEIISVQAQYEMLRPDMVIDLSGEGTKRISVEIERNSYFAAKKVKKYEKQDVFKDVLLVSTKDFESDCINIWNLNIKEVV